MARIAKVVRMVRVTAWVLSLTGVSRVVWGIEIAGVPFCLQVKRKTAEQPHCVAREYHVALNIFAIFAVLSLIRKKSYRKKYCCFAKINYCCVIFLSTSLSTKEV